MQEWISLVPICHIPIWQMLSCFELSSTKLLNATLSFQFIMKHVCKWLTVVTYSA